jgi:hypothetical protein
MSILHTACSKGAHSYGSSPRRPAVEGDHRAAGYKTLPYQTRLSAAWRVSRRAAGYETPPYLFR